jgi:hypothetical protein
MIRADRAVGLTFLVVFALMLLQATDLPYTANFSAGAGFMPVWLSALGIAISLAITVSAWRASTTADSESGSPSRSWWSPMCSPPHWVSC